MEMLAYIDESGDDGTGGKGTKWFIVTAIIVSVQEASALGEAYKLIKSRINLGEAKPLHWSHMSHLRKKAIIDILSRYDFLFCSTLVDTQHEDVVNTKPKLRGRRLYFYALRRLLERISWLCDDKGYKVRIYPENKAGIRYSEFLGYLNYIQNQPDCQIRKGCIVSIKPKSKTQSNLLQLVDCVCGAVFNAVEHKYGVIEDSYLLALKNKLYRRANKLLGYGIKFMPHRSDQIHKLLISEFDWLNKL